MKLSKGQHLLFVGDSITDCGRRDVHVPYGDGYVSLVNAFLKGRYPELALRITNQGVGGDRVRDLAARWQRDVIDERPDWLSIKIGINDVWRYFDSEPHMGVPVDEYDETFRRLAAEAIEKTGCNLIIIEPYHIERNHDDPQRSMLDDYRATARKIAEDMGAIFVETQSAFDKALETTVETDWAADKVHPNQAGHAIIAMQVLRALDFTL